MDIFRSRSRIDDRIGEKFEEMADSPESALKEQRKKMLLMAHLIKEMTETDGWKLIIGPFLEKNGNPARLFNKSPEEYMVRAPKVQAYYNLLNLVKNLLSLLNTPVEEKEEEGEEGEGEETPLP